MEDIEQHIATGEMEFNQTKCGREEIQKCKQDFVGEEIQTRKKKQWK